MPREPIFGVPMVHQQLTMQPELKCKLNKIAKSRGQTLSSLLRPLLAEYANKYYPEISDSENLGDC